MSKRRRIVRASTPDGQRAGELVVEVVENQIREKNPPEVAATLERLIKEGKSREEAMRLLACVLIVEIFDITRNNRPFNGNRYVENLRRLPDLPQELPDEI